MNRPMKRLVPAVPATMVVLAAVAVAQAPEPPSNSTPAVAPAVAPLLAQRAAVGSTPWEWRAVVDATHPVQLSRLIAWLDAEDHRAAVRAQPTRVLEFNALPKESGAVDEDVAWVAHIVRADKKPGAWGLALSQIEGDWVASMVVPLFSAEEFRAGPTSAEATLVELVPVQESGAAFGAADLTADSVKVDDFDGQSGLSYEMRPERRLAFDSWKNAHEGGLLALVARGVMVTAWRHRARSALGTPAFNFPGDAMGRLAGAFSRDELESLAREMRAAAEAAPGAPAAPTASTAAAKPAAATPPAATVVDAPTPSPSQIPTGNDPGDIRAIAGAQQMLIAEKKLREMIKAGKVAGIDRILSFDEIASWPYEDGLNGMPEAVKRLDGGKVLMTGFMLPIDQVEKIKEFLLVQSLWSCCYGQPPDINGIVRVVMQGDARIDYQFDPIKVVGTFRVKATKEDGYVVDIFQLEAESVSVIK